MERGYELTAAWGAISSSHRDTTIDYTPDDTGLQGFFASNARMRGQIYTGTEPFSPVPGNLRRFRSVRIVSPDKAGRPRRHKLHIIHFGTMCQNLFIPLCLLFKSHPLRWAAL